MGELSKLRWIVARNICSAVKKSHLTPKEIAANVGVSMATLSHWRCGKRSPTIKNIERLAESLRMDPSELFEPVADGE